MNKKVLKLRFSYKYKKLFESLLLKNKYRYVLVSGGRGSGKTTALNNALLLRSLLGLKEVIIYTRYFERAVFNSYKDIKTLAYDLNYPLEFRSIDRNKTILYKNSKVLFGGIFNANRSQSLKSIDNASTLIVEEASAVKDINDILVIQKSLRHNRIPNTTYLVYNPISKKDSIYQYFFSGRYKKKIDKIQFDGKEYIYETIDEKDILHIHTTFLDNYKNLPQDFIEEALELSKVDEVLFKRDYLGIYVDLFENQVFKGVEYIDEIPNDLPSLIGVDFGYRDKTAFVLVSFDKNKKILFAKQLFYRNNVTVNELYDLFRSFYNEYQCGFVCDINLKYLTEQLNAEFNRKLITYKDSRATVKQKIVDVSKYKIIVSGKELYNDIYSLEQKSDNVFCNEYGNHLTDAFLYAAYELLKTLRKKTLLLNVFKE